MDEEESKHPELEEIYTEEELRDVDVNEIEKIFESSERDDEIGGYADALDVPAFYEEPIMTDRELTLKEYFTQDPDPEHVVDMYKNANYTWKNKMEEFYKIHEKDPYNLKHAFFTERFADERQLSRLYTARQKYYSLNHYLESRTTKQSGLAKSVEVSEMVDTIKQLARLTRIYGLFITSDYKSVSKTDAYLMSVESKMKGSQKGRYRRSLEMSPYEGALCRRILALEIANLSDKNNPVEIEIKKFNDENILLSGLPEEGRDVYKNKIIAKFIEETNAVVNRLTGNTRKVSLLDCLIQKEHVSETQLEPQDIAFYRHYIITHKNATVSDFEKRFGWILTLKDSCVVDIRTPAKGGYIDSTREERRIVNKALSIIGMTGKPSYYYNNYKKLYKVCLAYLQFLGVEPSDKIPDPKEFLKSDGSMIDITDNEVQMKIEKAKVNNYSIAYAEKHGRFPTRLDPNVNKKLIELCKNPKYEKSLTYYYEYKFNRALSYYDINEDPDPMIIDLITEILPEIFQLIGYTHYNDVKIAKKIEHYRSQNKLQELYQFCLDYKNSRRVSKESWLRTPENVEFISQEMGKHISELTKDDFGKIKEVLDDDEVEDYMKYMETTLAYKNILNLEPTKPIKFLKQVTIRVGTTRSEVVYIPDIDFTVDEIAIMVDNMQAYSNELKHKIHDLKHQIATTYFEINDEKLITILQNIENTEFLLSYVNMNNTSNIRVKPVRSVPKTPEEVREELTEKGRKRVYRKQPASKEEVESALMLVPDFQRLLRYTIEKSIDKYRQHYRITAKEIQSKFESNIIYQKFKNAIRNSLVIRDKRIPSESEIQTALIENKQFEKYYFKTIQNNCIVKLIIEKIINANDLSPELKKEIESIPEFTTILEKTIEQLNLFTDDFTPTDEEFKRALEREAKRSKKISGYLISYMGRSKSKFNGRFWERSIKKYHKPTIDLTAVAKKKTESNIQYITAQGLTKGYNGHYDYLVAKYTECIYTIKGRKTRNFIEFLTEYKNILIEKENLASEHRIKTSAGIKQYKLSLLDKLKELKPKIVELELYKKTRPKMSRSHLSAQKHAEIHKLNSYIVALRKKKESLETKKKKYIITTIGEEMVMLGAMEKTEFDRLIKNPFKDREYDKLIRRYTNTKGRQYKYPAFELPESSELEAEFSDIENKEKETFANIISIQNTIETVQEIPDPNVAKIQISRLDLVDKLRTDFYEYREIIGDVINLQVIEEIEAKIIEEIALLEKQISGDLSEDTDRQTMLQKLKDIDTFIAVSQHIKLGEEILAKVSRVPFGRRVKRIY